MSRAGLGLTGDPGCVCRGTGYRALARKPGTFQRWEKCGCKPPSIPSMEGRALAAQWDAALLENCVRDFYRAIRDQSGPLWKKDAALRHLDAAITAVNMAGS